MWGGGEGALYTSVGSEYIDVLHDDLWVVESCLKIGAVLSYSIIPGVANCGTIIYYM